MHSFYPVLWSENLVLLCHKKKLYIIQNKAFEDNFEPPFALFDINASQGNQCLNMVEEVLEKIYSKFIARCQVSNPSCIFKFANLKRDSSGYPSAMFLDDAKALNTQ
jgi:hypothetical protein